jgi:hypothetical protein
LFPFGSFVGPGGFFVKPYEALGGFFDAGLVRSGNLGLAVAQAVVTGDQQRFGLRVLLMRYQVLPQGAPRAEGQPIVRKDRESVIATVAWLPGEVGRLEQG